MRRSDVQLLGVVLIWGVNFPVTKWATGRIDAQAFNALRFVFAAALLVLLARRGDGLAPAGGWTRALVGKVVALGLLGNFCYQSMFILGIDHTTAGNSALLIATAPVWTAVFAHVGGVERLPRIAAGGLVLAFAGVGSIVAGTHGLAFSLATAYGDLVSVVAAACWGAYTVLSRPLLDEIGATPLALWCVLVGLPGLWVLGAPGLAAAPLADPWIWVAIGYSGTLSIGLAYAVWNRAVADVGPSQTAIYGNLVPVVALLASWAWIGEPVGPGQALGAAMILAGLQLGRRARSSGQS